MIKLYLKLSRRDVLISLLLLALALTGYGLYRNTFVDTDFEIADDFGGNLFPSAILSLATTDEQIIVPTDSLFVGNPKSNISIVMRSMRKNTQIRVEVAETPFSKYSISEFVLPKSWTTYRIYPEIIWKYDALRENKQATPMSIVVTVTVNGKTTMQHVRTFSMRSINECMLGYYRVNGGKRQFVSTRQLFAAYVNEDNPTIDKVLREALNTRLVNRFLGYQADSTAVVKQVYALWNVLQRRHFKYSSISNSSLSSNVVYAQRVRTFDDALNASQINCVDGSVLFASLLRAIAIDPILVRIPGHMFVGFYTDKQHKHRQFLETTMIGNINLDDYFPDEKLDSTLVGKSQNEMSRITFEKSLEYARAKFAADSAKIERQAPGYMYLEISDNIRRRVQPIGK